ncbi:MAG TPA: polyamine ABC transporter substrate-binding protein [Chloroflexi bacterium]|nr:polyamine ABC transporter substrate-binding protein [Chloroflexota bacterium]
MLSKKTILLLFVVIALLALVVACGGAATPETVTVVETVTVIETVEVIKEVEGEKVTVVETVEVVKEVEKEVVVTATPEPKEAVMLRYADKAADLGTMDPHFAAATQDRNLVDMIFNALVRYKPGDGSAFEPDLAEALPEPVIEGGKQVWTFNLRRGVMCHPSEAVPAYELTAADVVFSLQKSANADTSAYAGAYNDMTVEALDDYTVKITLDNPVSPVLFFPNVSDYAGGFIICQKSYEAIGAEAFKTNPVGTGPFMFDSYSAQEKVVLVANDNYFRGRPLLDGVDYRFMPELNSRELGLLSGELDVINGAAEGIWVDRINQEEGVRVDVYGVGEVATIHFDITVEPLNIPEVRKAIAYALDRDEFLALFGEPVAANVYSQVPAKFLAGGLTQSEVQDLGLEYALDRDKAKALLAEAGYPDGFSLKMVSSERESYLKNYQSMQAQLAEIGIEIEIEVVDHSSMHSLIREDANPIVIYVAWRPNADVYLTRFYHSDSIVVSGAKPDTNFSHYDQIDELIESARVELDAGKQVEMWKEAQIKILEDMVAYPLQYQNQVTARNVNVDYGHELKSVFALYPQITENTRITGK